jgi:hypothetical protein
VKHAVRQLLRTPAFTAIAVLMLATGIATTTTMFAIVDELMLKPGRAPGDDRVHHLGAGYGYLIQIPDYEMLVTNRPAGVTALAAFEDSSGDLAQIPGRAEYVRGWRVSGQYADVYAVRAELGRWISTDDNVGGEADPKVTSRGVTRTVVAGSLGADVAVISHRLWREWFHGARDVIERGTITLIVGSAASSASRHRDSRHGSTSGCRSAAADC